MSRKYKFRDNDRLYFATFSVVYWIDLFIRKQYKDILLNSWQYCMEKKGMELYAWVIMTSHVHMIIGSHQDNMENIMRDMKKHTSQELRKAIQDYDGESRKEWMMKLMRMAGQKNSKARDFQLWQEGNHPIELFTPKVTHQKLDYIHNNPVEAAIVEKPEEYWYSSARDYYGMKGLIDIMLPDPLIM